MHVPGRFYVFMLLALLCLCMTACANMQFTTSLTVNSTNKQVSLASFSQGGLFTDSTPYLVGYPSQLDKNNCQTSNSQVWTCVLTLYGQNISNTIYWNAYTSNAGISISPHNGFLAKIANMVQITISNIPCTNASFLFSGQVNGGGGVIPTTIIWSCTLPPTPTPRPTSIPTPTPRPTSIPTPKPSPTSKITIPTATSGATIIPGSTSTITSMSSSVTSSSQHNNQPTNGNSDSSVNIFMLLTLILTVLVAITELFIIISLTRRNNG